MRRGDERDEERAETLLALGGAYAQMWMLQQQEEGVDAADNMTPDAKSYGAPAGGVA